MATFDSNAFDVTAFDLDAWDIDGVVPPPVNPVMSQEDNGGSVGVGRLPKRFEHVALIQFDFSFAFDADFERDTIDDDILAAIMLAVAEAA